MTVSKMTRMVEVSLNGDAGGVDPAVRRTLYTIAGEMDEQSEMIAREVAGVRRLLLTMTGTFVLTILTGVVNVLLTL